MLNPLRLPSVEKTGSQSRQQVQPFFSLPQQQRATIGGDRSSIEPGHNLVPSASFESETGLDTLCHKQKPLLVGANCCLETQLCHEERLFATGSVRIAG